MPEQFHKLGRKKHTGAYIHAYVGDVSTIIVPHTVPCKEHTHFSAEAFDKRLKFEHHTLSKVLGIPCAELPRRLPAHIEEKHFNGEPAYVRHGYRDLNHEDFFKGKELKTGTIDSIMDMFNRAAEKGILLDARAGNFGVRESTGQIVIRDLTGVIMSANYHPISEDMLESRLSDPGTWGKKTETLRDMAANSFIKVMHELALDNEGFSRVHNTDNTGFSDRDVMEIERYLVDKHGIRSLGWA